jgi:hypothetical protein
MHARRYKNPSSPDSIGRSSTPQLLNSIMSASEYWVARSELGDDS